MLIVWTFNKTKTSNYRILAIPTDSDNSPNHKSLFPQAVVEPVTDKSHRPSHQLRAGSNESHVPMKTANLDHRLPCSTNLERQRPLWWALFDWREHTIANIQVGARWSAFSNSFNFFVQFFRFWFLFWNSWNSRFASANRFSQFFTKINSIFLFEFVHKNQVRININRLTINRETFNLRMIFLWNYTNY